jgi:hypothetical protein
MFGTPVVVILSLISFGFLARLALTVYSQEHILSRYARMDESAYQRVRAMDLNDFRRWNIALLYAW